MSSSVYFERKPSLRHDLTRKQSATSSTSSRSSTESRRSSLASSSKSRSQFSSFFHTFGMAKATSARPPSPATHPTMSSEGLAWHLVDYERQAGERAALTPWEAYLPFTREDLPKKFEMSAEERLFRGIKAETEPLGMAYSPLLTPPRSNTSTPLPSPSSLVLRCPVNIAKTTAPVIPAQYPPLPWMGPPPDNVVPYVPPKNVAPAVAYVPPTSIGMVICPPPPVRPPRQKSSPSLPPSPALSYDSVQSFCTPIQEKGRGIVRTPRSPQPCQEARFTASITPSTTPVCTPKFRASPNIDIPSTRVPSSEVPVDCSDGSYDSIGSSFNELSIRSPTFADFTSASHNASGYRRGISDEEMDDEKLERENVNWQGGRWTAESDLLDLDPDDADANQWSDIEEPAEQPTNGITDKPPFSRARSVPTPITAPPAHHFLQDRHCRSPRSPVMRSPCSPRSRVSLSSPTGSMPRGMRHGRRKTLGLPPLPSSTLKRYHGAKGRRLSIVIEGSTRSATKGTQTTMPQPYGFPVDVCAEDEEQFPVQ